MSSKRLRGVWLTADSYVFFSLIELRQPVVIGLDELHQATNGRGCRLRVDLWDFDDDHAFAEYR